MQAITIRREREGEARTAMQVEEVPVPEPGAGDGLGVFAVQLCKLIGANPIAVVGTPEKEQVVRELGAELVIGRSATTGYELTFDVRHLWMRQKQIIGSHFANAYQAERANRLVAEGKIRPVLDKVFPFAETPEAHQLMADNKHKGKLGIRVQAPAP